MANYTMENLRQDSIRVRHGMITVYPQYNAEDVIHLSDVATFNGAYSSNNGTLAFVENDTFFVTPATRRAYKALRAAGFVERYFYVPFSNWDYPKEEKKRWEELRAMQQELMKKDFAQDCIEYCDEHFIGALEDDILERCFTFPTNGGVEVQRFDYKTTYYPIINIFCFDSTVPGKIGRYSYNNGRVVFTYRDGTTRVARGYWIINELVAVGYKEGALFVPFSNGEQIVDPDLRAAWEKVSK